MNLLQGLQIFIYNDIMPFSMNLDDYLGSCILDGVDGHLIKINNRYYHIFHVPRIEELFPDINSEGNPYIAVRLVTKINNNTSPDPMHSVYIPRKYKLYLVLNELTA